MGAWKGSYLELHLDSVRSLAVQEIVERHSTLETANIDLAEIQTESETQIEETAASFLGSCQGCCNSSVDSIEVA